MIPDHSSDESATDEELRHELLRARAAVGRPAARHWRWALGVAALLAAAAIVVTLSVQPPLTTISVDRATALAAAGVPCSETGDNCAASRCCADAGLQCYEKNAYWAGCRAACVVGIDPADTDPIPVPWSCELLSGIATSSPAVQVTPPFFLPTATPAVVPPVEGDATLGGDAAPPPLVPAAAASVLGTTAASPPAAEECSWEGEDCRQSRCCTREGFRCFEKNELFAGCRKSCIPGSVDQADEDGLPWDCTALGEPQAPHSVPGAATLAEAAGTSLFCFMAEVPGPETELVSFLQQKGLGAFACDASAVFQGVVAEKSFWKSWANIDSFLKVWEQVEQDGQYLDHDFTAKVDPDAVFFPDRLKVHLESLKPPARAALYLRNTDFKFHFMGAIEVLSRSAVKAYVARAAECSSHFGHEGGEDFYMETCLDAIGVGYVSDYSLLSDKYASSKRLILEDVGDCKNDAAVALHPYKSPQIWMGCHDVAMGVLSLPGLVTCAQRTDAQPVCRQ